MSYMILTNQFINIKCTVFFYICGIVLLEKPTCHIFPQQSNPNVIGFKPRPLLLESQDHFVYMMSKCSNMALSCLCLCNQFYCGHHATLGILFASHVYRKDHPHPPLFAHHSVSWGTVYHRLIEALCIKGKLNHLIPYLFMVIWWAPSFILINFFT